MDARDREPVRARDGSEAPEKSPSYRLLILGGPGMGKTILLKALFQKAIDAALVEPAAPLPLFLSLPALARSGEALVDYLPHVPAELEIKSAFAAELSSAIISGRAFLCLDRLDEVLPAQRPDVIALLNRQAPGVRRNLGHRLAIPFLAFNLHSIAIPDRSSDAQEADHP